MNVFEKQGLTPLVRAIYGRNGCSSPRIARLLIDARANSTSAVRMTDDGGKLSFFGTPLAFATRILREKRVGGKDIAQEQLRRLEVSVACCCGWRQFMLSLGGGLTRSSQTRTIQGALPGVRVFDPDHANLEEKGCKTEGALGGPVQVCYFDFLMICLTLLDFRWNFSLVPREGVCADTYVMRLCSIAD